MNSICSYSFRFSPENLSAFTLSGGETIGHKVQEGHLDLNCIEAEERIVVWYVEEGRTHFRIKYSWIHNQLVVANCVVVNLPDIWLELEFTVSIYASIVGRESIY